MGRCWSPSTRSTRSSPMLISSGNPAEHAQYHVSPHDVVTIATSLLADPEREPSLRDKIRELGGRHMSFNKKEMDKEVRTHLADAPCASGVALALLPLCVERVLRVKCDYAGEDAVAAFYAALEQPTCTVEELTMCGDAFGMRDAAARLARCLNSNSAIRKLTIHYVAGFGTKTVRSAFSHTLTSNTTLQELGLTGLGCGYYAYNHGQWSSGHSRVCAALTDSHKLSALREIDTWSTSNEEDMARWGAVLKHNSIITKLKLVGVVLSQGGGLLVPVCLALLTNTTLQTLVIRTHNSIDVLQSNAVAAVDMDVLEDAYSYVEEDPEEASFSSESYNADDLSLAAMLRTNHSLTHLDIMRSGSVCSGSVFFEGLSQNTTLDELRISVDAAGARSLMTALTTSSTAIGDTTTSTSSCPHLKSLHLGEQSYGILDSSLLLPIGSQSFPSAVALRDMLASNGTLVELCLGGAPYSSEEWAVTILPALANNICPQKLDLAKCPGVDGGIVYDALLNLLDSNSCIAHIDLSGTRLGKEGKAQTVEARIKTNKEYYCGARSMESSVLRNSCAQAYGT